MNEARRKSVFKETIQVVQQVAKNYVETQPGISFRDYVLTNLVFDKACRTNAISEGCITGIWPTTTWNPNLGLFLPSGAVVALSPESTSLTATNVGVEIDWNGPANPPNSFYVTGTDSITIMCNISVGTVTYVPYGGSPYSQLRSGECIEHVDASTRLLQFPTLYGK